MPKTPGVVRIRGRLLTVYDKKRQRFVTRSWQTNNGGPTPDRNLAKSSFKQSVALIKNSVDLDMIASIELAAGTPYLPRDLRMKATFGTLIIAYMADGRVLTGGRAVAVNVSDLLDQITDTPGALLQRTPTQWQGTEPTTTDGYVLTWNQTTHLWEARAIPAPTPSAPFHPGYQPNQFYASPHWATQNASTATGTIIALPFYSGDQHTWTRASVNVTTGLAGSHAAIGVYENNNGIPGALLVDCGRVSTAGVGQAELSGLNIPLDVGWYWLAVGVSGTISLKAVADGGGLQRYLLGDPNISTATDGLQGNWTYSATVLPDPFPTVAYRQGQTTPLVYLRR